MLAWCKVSFQVLRHTGAEAARESGNCRRFLFWRHSAQAAAPVAVHAARLFSQ